MKKLIQLLNRARGLYFTARKLTQWVRDGLVSFWCRRHRQYRYRLVYTDEVPSEIGAYELSVVGEGVNRWYIVLQCPCGCGNLIQLSLLAGDRPRWRLEEHGDGTMSLTPSVHRTVGCRSHFFLRHGRIEWCR